MRTAGESTSAVPVGVVSYVHGQYEHLTLDSLVVCIDDSIHC